MVGESKMPMDEAKRPMAEAKSGMSQDVETASTSEAIALDRRAVLAGAAAAIGVIAAGKTAGPAVAAEKLASAKAFRVYPPIGIARIGNARTQNDEFAADYLFSPEVIGGVPTLPGGEPTHRPEDFRNSDGQIRRHAVRFRIYAEFDDGTVAEVTGGSGITITWQVNVANLKAGWYDFQQAMDLPGGLAKEAKRRNVEPLETGMGRPDLDIVPGPIIIAGISQSGSKFQFSDGLFAKKPVYLGELRTDDMGRLIFLGGRGLSASAVPGKLPYTFANNDGWHDDVADGPIRATISWQTGSGEVSSREAVPGYVATTPPNYAPGLTGVVTMDDAVRQAFHEWGLLPSPTRTYFTENVWSVFARMTDLQWVNQGLFVAHGVGSPLDAHSDKVIERLRDKSKQNAGWRNRVLGLFRKFGDAQQAELALIPRHFGDAYGEVDKPHEWEGLSLTPTQYAHLERWAKGDFEDDWAGKPTPPNFAELPPQEQMLHLERASLHACLGGPFHPGIELTWVMRIRHLWSMPYRLKVMDGLAPARQDFGDVLTPEVCTGKDGPYDGVAAGALTRFLGVPWQTDGVSCNSDADYSPSTFLSMPSFWGARVPDQVLSEESFAQIERSSTEAGSLQALKYFALRSDWLRDIRGYSYEDRIAMATEKWALLGLLVPRHSMNGSLPVMQVEMGRPTSVKSYPDRNVVLVNKIESLDSDPSTIVMMSGTTLKQLETEKVYVRSSNTYRQGEI